MVMDPNVHWKSWICEKKKSRRLEGGSQDKQKYSQCDYSTEGNEMKEKMIRIPARKVTINEQGGIKLTREAMEALVEITNQTNMSLKQVASEIITQAYKNELISFDREENLKVKKD